MTSMASFPVKKIQQQTPKTGSKGDPEGPREGTNMSMPAPGPTGHPSPPAATTHDPYFANEFRAAADLKTLIESARIKGDKRRLADAQHYYREIKGKNNAGVRTGKMNSFDNRDMSRGNTGKKLDGSKGRW